MVRGEALFKKEVKNLPVGSKELPGRLAWRLYDTYGFPVDLTQLMAEEHNLVVDMEEYEKKKKEAAVTIGDSKANVIRHLDHICSWIGKIQGHLRCRCSSH